MMQTSQAGVSPALFKKLSIVIPTLNEEEAISNTLVSIPKRMLNDSGYAVEVIVVDGQSQDRTREIALEHDARVIVERRRGYGVPIRTGLRNATGDYIMKADGDNTYPLAMIPEFLRMMDFEGLDFLTTNRFTSLDPGIMSFRNLLGNRILCVLVRLLFGLKLGDTQSGMWIIKSKALGRLVLQSNISFSQEIKIEALYFARLRWKEVPIKYRARVGRPKFGNVITGFRLVLALFLLRLRTGNRVQVRKSER